MYKIPLEEIVGIICKKTGLDRTSITLKIQKKVEELSGLISMEGAAHVVANELGIELLDTSDKFLKIGDIIPGLRSIAFSGKVNRVFPVYSFEKGGRKGKVASVLISDSTGEIRLVIWNSGVELVENGSIKEDDNIRVYNVFVKEGRYGMEAHMRDKSKLEIEHSSPNSPAARDYADIKDIEPDSRVLISGSLVDIFSKAFVFKSCPKCKKKLDPENLCKEHGRVEPENSFILNTIIDDSTDSVRCVFFGRQVEELLGTDKAELLDMVNSGRDPMIAFKPRLMGAEVEISGKSRMSSFDNKMEIVVSSSRLLEPKAEAKRLLETLEKGS